MMGLFNMFNKTDINAANSQFASTPGAVLLDVRSPMEYREGHLPHSRNIPLPNIHQAEQSVPEKDTPLFVYCLSGGRSGQAVSALKNMGYSNVTNMGGINSYRGKVEK